MTENELTKRYSYELEAWRRRLGSDPVEEIVSQHYGRYEWDSAVLWRLESGQYALITGSGCSCNWFGSEDDRIALYQNEQQARIAFSEWDYGVSK